MWIGQAKGRLGRRRQEERHHANHCSLYSCWSNAHQTKKHRQNIERKTTTVSTSEGTAVSARGPFPFPSFPLALCAPGGMVGGSRDRQLPPALVRQQDSGSVTAGQKSLSQLRFWGLTRTTTRFHFISEDDWFDVYSIPAAFVFFIIIPLINVSNVPTDKSLKLYILYNKRVTNYLKNSHYYDCHRNEWLSPHLARLYLHAVFRKQNLSELNLWKMQTVSTTYQHYMTWFEYFFVEIIFVWSCNKLWRKKNMIHLKTISDEHFITLSVNLAVNMTVICLLFFGLFLFSQGVVILFFFQVAGKKK